MHLAAISNDPMGDMDPDLTWSVNRDGSIRLADLAKQAGVGRFLFSGSCSVYGKCGSEALNESSELNPLTAYAESKIKTEEHVSQLADDGFTPAYLRNATAYGHSPALRIDLVANNLLASAICYGEIRIMSDGTPWRPLIHCKDIARAFVAFAEAPKEAIHNKAINIGGNDENYQVKDVADQVQALLPEATVAFTGEAGPDPRDYAVNFDLLGKCLPDFRLEYDLQKGMQELYDKYRQHNFSAADFEGDQFIRLRTLSSRLELLRS
ncbi:MAG: NAD-dependent epimerase/dehydratase family protein [Planctomycetota bacterium]|jgi:nucleoside-diphosphate-sugar epimerase